MKEIINCLLEASDSQLDAVLKPDIGKWTDPPDCAPGPGDP
jgi:hypothetical protein